MSLGLIKGAEKTGDLLNYGTPKLLNHISPANEAKPIPTNVQKSLEVAQDISGKAVQVSGFIGKYYIEKRSNLDTVHRQHK